MIPVVFSALAMNSVGKAAMDMVNEVRRQFREIPGILEGTGTPEYGKCVEISTRAALREMILPGIITIVTPIIVGMTMGPEALGAYMAGVTVSGVLWAIFQNNAGGAWDNAKKSFEKGVDINGQTYYKKSEPHKAAVVGDTVGDPFKDTSGPSMNILIKLTSLVGLTIAPLIAMNNGFGSAGDCMGQPGCHGQLPSWHEQMMNCEMDSSGNCIVDSSICTALMADGTIDSTACMKMEGGKCWISKDSYHCPNNDGSHEPVKGCNKGCLSACQAAGIKCGNGTPCPMQHGDAVSCAHHHGEEKKNCCKK